MATTLVTGSSRGIGLALCRQLLARGDEVIAVCRNASPALNDLEARVETGVDVSRPENISDLAARLKGVKLAVLINDAGILSRQLLGEIDEAAVAAIKDQYAVNSVGPLLVTQALLGNLSAGSKVAIVTSRMGSITDNTSGGSYGYRMSKAAVNIAGKSLAHDLKDRGIAVALLHPGWIRTEMTSGTGNADAAEAAAGLIARIDELTLETTGGFWHANGERLPW